MPNQDPTFVANQTDPTPGAVDPIQNGQAAQTARRAPGQRQLSAKEREQRQMALCATVPSKEEAMCQCTKVLHFSVFFDGTDNNREAELAKASVDERELTNIAKLFDAHKFDQQRVIKRYIPGVGTPYPEIGDSGGLLGSAIGKGSEARVKKAISLLDEEIAKVPAEQKLRLINVTVFGFSRGAAQARAFLRELAALCQEKDGAYEYKGKPLRIAFAGLFDTVCSAYDGIPSAALTYNGGHNGWAHDMKLPAMVEQTVHMNAAHELRRRFPLDSTRIDASYPDNTVEVWYPGVHADVGGGYSAQYQGRNNTISRFALNHMFDLAFAGGVMFQRVEELDPTVKREFTTDDPELRSVFNAYIDAVQMKSGPMEEVQAAHMGLFHRWLKKRVLAKADTASVERLRAVRDKAKAAVREARRQRVDLEWQGGARVDEVPVFSVEEQRRHDELLKKEKDSARIAAEASSALRDLNQENAKYLWDVEDIQWRAARGGRLSLRERTIKEAWDNPTDLPEDVQKFFDLFAHDSVAHFNFDTSRLSDWRTIFFGDTKYKPS